METKREFSSEEMFKISTAVYNKHFNGCSDIREDLIGEGVLGIVSAVRNYDDYVGCSLSTYAWNCARGRMSVFYRKEKRIKERFVALTSDHLLEDESKNFKESLYKREELEKVMAIIDKLKEKEKEIVLGIIEGIPQSHIASKIGITKQAVNSKWKILKDDIRKEYEGKGKVRRRWASNERNKKV
jgi:RNA polymerase sigma factor (sigma-70 family)